MAVIEFFVEFTCFCGEDIKARRGVVYTWWEGRVREVVIDEVPYLPEDGLVHGFVGTTLDRPVGLLRFQSLQYVFCAVNSHDLLHHHLPGNLFDEFTRRSRGDGDLPRVQRHVSTLDAFGGESA